MVEGRIRKPPSTDHAQTASESKKLRNRLSQKAFRARQSIHIKELEKRLEYSSKSETERNAGLENRNEFYRNELLGCHKKLESLQVTLKALADSVAFALEMNIHSSPATQEDSDQADNDTPICQSSVESLPSAAELLHTPPKSDRLQISVPGSRESMASRHGDHSVSHQLVQASSNFNYGDLDPGSVFSNNHLQAFDFTNCSPDQLGHPSGLQVPRSLPVHIGSDAYGSIVDRGPLLVNGHDFQLRGTNSLFSDHIAVLEHFLRKKWVSSGAVMKHKHDGLASSVGYMIDQFISISWPAMIAFYAHTKAQTAVADLTTWRLNSTPETYSAIVTDYRPTHIQLSVPHPRIIDWVPFPAMRDKLILHHSANPNLDDIICEIGDSYVVETDLSKLVAGTGGPMDGYVGVWELVKAISPHGTAKVSEQCQQQGPENLNDSFDSGLGADQYSRRGSMDDPDLEHDLPCSLPAPSVEALFRSRVLALQAFRMLNMDGGVVKYLLDPRFFANHPELYDSNSNLVARGVHLSPPGRASLPAALPLVPGIMSRYQELVTLKHDLTSAGIT